jgi:hypothetical protein
MLKCFCIKFYLADTSNEHARKFNIPERFFYQKQNKQSVAGLPGS